MLLPKNQPGFLWLGTDAFQGHVAPCAVTESTNRRRGGILVGIFYDHLLARDWAEHHDDALATYCREVYREISGRLSDLPEPARHVLQLMASEDRLQSYAEIDGIADVLRRMSRRAQQQPNPLAGGEAEFVADVAVFAA